MQAPLPIVSPTTEQPRMSLSPMNLERDKLISSRYESNSSDARRNRCCPPSRDHLQSRLCDSGVSPKMVQSFPYVHPLNCIMGSSSQMF
jgi:hypothetical protein